MEIQENSLDNIRSRREMLQRMAGLGLKVVAPSLPFALRWVIDPESVKAQSLGMKSVTLQGEDGGDVSYLVPSGFIPDGGLKANSQLKLESLQASDLTTYVDFQKSLNNPADPLAGFYYALNDESDNVDFRRQTQYPAWAWTAITALRVVKPKTGEMVGGDHMGVLFLYINRGDNVEKDITLVESGAIMTGPLWDADDPQKLLRAIRGLSAHHAGRMLELNPDNGFRGNCDDARRNCDTMLRVVVDRVQWGLNPEGSRRFYDRLVGADYVTAAGSIR